MPPGFKEYIANKHIFNTSTCLMRLKEKKGFVPEYIVDVGAYKGSWTEETKEIFPDSRILMIEAQPDKETYLKKIKDQFPSTVDYTIRLLGAEEKDAVSFFKLETGSSVLKEQSNAPYDVTMLPMHTLDKVIAERNIPKVSLLKLDVQGFELEVLRGARETLKNTEVILLEVSFLPFNKDCPLFNDVINFMKEQGFLVYDIGAIMRWRKDKTLLQADIFFVKKYSPWRLSYFEY